MSIQLTFNSFIKNALIYSCIFSVCVNNNLHAAAIQDQSAVKARSFKFYKEYFYKDSRIVVQNNTRFKNITVNKGPIKLAISQNQSKKLIEYSIKSQNKKHYVLIKQLAKQPFRVGYYSKAKQTYYLLDPKLCKPFSNPINENYIDSMTDKIADLNIKNLFDSNTCSRFSDEKYEEVVDQIKLALYPTKSDLVSCFNEPAIQEKLNSNYELGRFATNLINEYLKLNSQLTDPKKPIKISCEISDQSNKLASINEATEPMTISIDVKKLSDTNKITKNAITPFINHELMHLESSEIQTLSSKEEIDKNEKMVNYINCLCNTKNNLSDICETNPDFIEIFDKKKYFGGITAANTLQQQNQNNVAQIAQDNTIANNLAQNIKPATFTAVSDEAIDTLANSVLQNKSGTTLSEKDYGKVIEVASNETLSKSLDQVYTAASGITQSINTALSASINTAQASPNSALNKSSGSSRQPASISSTSGSNSAILNSSGSSANKVLSREEIKIDQNSAKFESPTDSPNYQPKTTSSTLAGKTTENKVSGFANDGNSKKAVDAAGNPISLATSGNAGMKATAANQGTANSNLSDENNNASSGSNSNSTNAIADEVNQANEDENTADQKTNSANTQKRNVASVNSANPQSDNITLQKLSVFSKINGNEYSQIQKKYKDQTFSNQLASRNIRIQISTANGKIAYIGSSQTSATIFIDTGSSLVKANK